MKASIITLGCKVNQCESNSLLYQLQKKGYKISKDFSNADLVIVNTCAVTHEAHAKSKQIFRRVLAKNPDCKLIIAGCASQNSPNEFFQNENVLVWGAKNKQFLVENLEKSGMILSENEIIEEEIFCINEKTRGYVKIEDGCENYCAYCIVPHLRGKIRSVSIDCIKKQLNELKNCAEIVLTGINLSAYGKDTGTSLIELCEAISTPNQRLRFGSLEPVIIRDGFLERLTKLNVCAHFHLSLQSGSNAVLLAMNRKYTREEYLICCQKIRKYFSQCGITTDIIVGFPTETERDFEDTLHLCRQAEFLDMHIFPYSKRAGTAAENLPELAPNIIKDRLKRLNALKKELQQAALKEFHGKTLQVIFEQFDKKSGKYVGHSREFVKVFSSEKQQLNREIEIIFEGERND